MMTQQMVSGRAAGDPLTEGWPDAPAILQVAEKHWIWEVACGFCGSRHLHGGGDLSENPRSLLGPRVSHCNTDRGGEIYWLRDADRDRTTALLWLSRHGDRDLLWEASEQSRVVLKERSRRKPK